MAESFFYAGIIGYVPFVKSWRSPQFIASEFLPHGFPLPQQTLLGTLEAWDNLCSF
jgi:hypothetical protein